MSKKELRATLLSYGVLTVGAAVMLYPLIWLFFATFKSNDEIFAAASIIPRQFTLDGYIDGWKGSGQYTFATYFLNTLRMVVPAVLCTVFSSAVVAFGFSRFVFPLKKLLFGLMIGTMMLPGSVMLIPRYLMYRDLNWLDTYLPFIMPNLFCTSAFFIFMFVQFFRGLPIELDESARIDGCNSVVVLTRILLPLSKPALFSAAMFQFMWMWNDFFGPLIHINSVSKYPLSLGLRMSMDVNAAVSWNSILAMALVSIAPLVLLFFFAQKYFVEGVATTGLKG